MTDFIVVPQTNQWQKLKALVLDSVSSPITRRVYNLGLDEFIAWYGNEPRPGCAGVEWEVTSPAGLGSSRSGVTPAGRLAGFADKRRPRGGRSSTPAPFK